MTGRLGQPLIRRDEVTSAMDELAALAASGAAEGTALLADHQTAGRGRAGRTWQSAPGTAILLAVLLRPTAPPARWTVLPLIAGIALAEALEAETGLSPRLKWPNDLLLDGRKVAGMLATARSSPPDRDVILGLGLNVNATAAQVPSGATSLLLETGEPRDRERLLETVLARLTVAYREFERTGGAFDPEEWERRAAFLGDWVSVESAGTSVRGTLVGVEHDGALIVLEASGDRHRIVAGDLSRGPRPVSGVSLRFERV